MISAISNASRNERGAAMVEFALVLPILVMLVLGIIEFGRVYNTQISLSGAAREGARAMAITNVWDGPTGARQITIDAAPTVTPAPAVSRTPSTCSPGADIEVTASQVYTFPLLGGPSVTLTGTGVMRCGG